MLKHVQHDEEECRYTVQPIGTFPALSRSRGNPFGNGDNDMLKWALIFLVVGLVLGALGFGGVGGAFVGIAKILFFIAIALFIIFALLALFAGKKISDAI
jgi:uncharacterized membrane protein YtjA (UPF0391 family)